MSPQTVLEWAGFARSLLNDPLRSSHNYSHEPPDVKNIGAAGTGLAPKLSLLRQCHAEPAAAAKHLGRASPPPPQIPRPSREGLGMTGRCPFPSAVVLVATSMIDSEERSDEESGTGPPPVSVHPPPKTPRGVYPERSRGARGDTLWATFGARPLGRGGDLNSSRGTPVLPTSQHARLGGAGRPEEDNE